ncbi:outer membrane beta-barrel family protein [soil metagenome]
MLILLKLQAQESPDGYLIKGNITDSISGLPLEYATISLFIKNNKKPISGTVTDKSGNFTLKDIPAGLYNMVIECIGYMPFNVNNVLLSKNRPFADINRISLLQQKNTLQNVTVTAQTRLIENRIDKMVFNAEKDLTSQSGVATDVLKKIPQVSVDADGNVQLSGSGGVRFLINGKPSAAFGSNIADVLQSIPASQIKSVEVITNPGAKYDAQGLGGIINIILKNSKAKGYNANLSLTAGTRMENGSFNFNVRNNNFGFNAYLSGNKRLNAKTPVTSERYTNDSSAINYLGQYGTGTYERHGFQAGVGFDYTYKKLNNFSGALSYNNFGNSGNRPLNQYLELNKGSGNAPVLSRIITNNRYKEEGIDASVNYKRTFAKEDQELEIAFNTSSGSEKNVSDNDQFLMPQDSLFYGTRSKNPGNTTETTINIDYTQPLKKDVVIGLGAKASFYNISSTSTVFSFQPLLQSYQQNYSLENDLRYRQKVYALYAEISLPVSNWFQTKIGGRYERTEINAYYAKATNQVKVPGYNTFVPSIFLSKKINDEQTIRLNYSKRIERPDYGDLNPFVNTSDPKNISAGNPYLQPELGHRFELAYNRNLGKKGSFMVSLFYRINERDIQPYINYYTSYKAGDSIYSNVAVTTRQNIGMEKNLGMNLFADLHITDKLSLRSNVALFRRHTINTLDHGYDYNSFNYRFNMNATYQFTNSLLAEFFGNFNSARNEAQGRYPSFTTYSLALRRQFWKKKGSLALTANNFLSEYVNQRTVLNGPGFSVNSTRKIPFRSVGLNFTWKFGKLEFKKGKEPDLNNNSGGE